MSRSFRTTPIKVDSTSLTRLMEVAREKGIYSNRREAENDNYEALISSLCDEVGSEDGA